MGIKDQYTKVDNKIDQQIDFVVDSGICPLHSLPAGKSQSVSLSLIIEECKKRGSATWPIHVLINNRLCGIHLHPHDHILMMMSIVFRYKWRPDGSRIPIAEGVRENFRDRILDCCIKFWDKRIYVEIAEADSTWRNIREVGAIVAAPSIGLENSPQSRVAVGPVSGRWRTRMMIASSTINRGIKRLKFGGGRGIPAAVMPVDRRQNRLLSLRRRLMFTHLLLFCFAFTLVAGGHLFRRLRFRGN